MAVASLSSIDGSVESLLVVVSVAVLVLVVSLKVAVVLVVVVVVPVDVGHEDIPVVLLHMKGVSFVVKSGSVHLVSNASS